MDSVNAGVTRLPIAALGENMPNVLIVGIIIAKQSIRLFNSKQSTSSESQRAVWNFTIRDSPYDLINSTFWGSKDYIINLADKFHIGDIVDVSRPKISFRETREQKDTFSPSVTSPFQLSLNEKQSMMVFHEADDCNEFFSLLHIPTKPTGDYFTLG
ncbi:hypothetical protein L9F63_005256 [Diploptera punctata]|uniref:MEIOB-like N-terminal domain-containing protein n=1 Tax=Diploptera punctata TaxID=6984 RepID=A0AAD7ZDX8_DIPPU|nr:hypothetical protein L9F63_005256 [Diploptera punctata]